MKAIYDFQKIGFKLKALFFVVILLASFVQLKAQTVTTTVDPSTICAGGSTTVQGNILTSPVTNGHELQWVWSGAGGTFTTTTTATNSGGTESASLVITPTASGTFTLTVTDIDPAGTFSGTATTGAVVVTTPPVATFSYTGSPYCQTASNPSPTFSGGGVAGTFTAPGGLVFVSTTTGQVNLSSSTPGTYTVTNTVAAAGGCATVTAENTITITALPVATFSYTGTPYCQSATNPSPTFSGGGVAGTFTSAPTGLVFVSASTGEVNLSASTAGTYTVTNTIAAASGCATVTAESPITITALPVATFSYTGTPYCQNGSNPSPTFSGGGVAGTFTSAPTGLVFVSASTGEVNLSASTAGTYTVTNTIAAASGCATVTAESPITITALPVATFSYTGTPYCQNGSNPSPTFSGGGVAGTFTSAPTGLVFVSSATGEVNLSGSTAGTYTVTNTIAAASGCATVTAESPITITALPVATFSYTGTPYCQNGSNPSPTFSGGGVAGTFTSAPTGLVFVSSATGEVNLSGSTAGTYTVTNTIAAASGCATVTAESPITITALPVATFSYTGTPYCQNGSNPSPTFSGGGVAGTFTAPAGLVFVSSATGQVNLSGSTAGTYTVTNTIAAASGCATVTAESPITITALPVATFSYTGTPYCQSASNPSPTFSGGGIAGTFTAPAGLVFVSSATGEVNLSGSTAGTYTVTNTIAAASGCATVTAESPITITALPVATFSYTGTPYCQSASNPSPTFSGGGIAGTFTAPAGLVFVSSSTGEVNLIASTPGTYTVTNTIAASGGCAAVIATASIEVKAGPVPLATNDGPVCVGGTLTLTGAAPPGSGLTITNYEWWGPPLFHVSQPNFQYSIFNMQLVNAGVYTLTVTYSNGCTNTDTTLVKVDALPTITPTSATSEVCQNTAMTPMVYTIGGSATGASITAGSLPTGVSGTFIGTTFTISGTPTGTPGPYPFTISTTGGTCTPTTATGTITVLTPPSITTFVYSGSPYCSNGGTANPTFDGTTGGSFASTTGLTVNSGTGVVTLGSPTVPGTYVVTYTVNGTGACSAVSATATASITITALPAATIAYTGSPYCGNGGTASVTLTGETGGTYSAPAGLSIDTGTGTVNLNASTAGTYTVTYTISAASGCPAVTATAPITITALPVATFSYTGTPYCKNASNPSPTFSGGGVAGTFTSAPTGLVFVSVTTGQIDLAASTAGTYTVTNTIAAASGCATVTAEAPITITTLPTATISYTTPVCSSAGSASVIQTGTTGGTYSISPTVSGVTVNATSGLVSFGITNSGTFTVTYTIAAASGCSAVTATAPITITALPVATFSYTGTPYCQNASDPSPTFSGGGVAGNFTAPTGLVFISSSTGQIDLSASTPGTYTVTNTIAAAGGCSAVTAEASITITALPVATFSYTDISYCQNVTNPTPTFSGGGVAGTFTAPTGLVFVSSTTGEVNLIASTPGTYTVTNTIAASGGCAAVIATAPITVKASPIPLATNNGPVCVGGAVTLTGAAPDGSGLTITNYAWDGPPSFHVSQPNYQYTIYNMQLINAGVYTLTATYSNGCINIDTTLVKVDALPTITPPSATDTVCQNTAMTPMVYTIGGSATGAAITEGSLPTGVSGTFTGTTFTISGTPTGTPGTYPFTVSTTGGTCTPTTATGTIVVLNPPSITTFVYSGSPYCSNGGTANPTFDGTTGGSFASTTGLTVNSGTGVVTLGSPTVPGTYIVTYTVYGTGACSEASATATATITITSLPTATIEYTGSPYCGNGGTASVTLTGASGGTYSAPAGLSIDAGTGTVNLNASTAGTYTVTYTIAAASGCPAVTATAPITITALPVATFSYTGTPYCKNASNPSPTFSGGGVAGTFTSAPTGLVFVSVTTGQIDLAASTAGTYTVTNTIAASSGCPAVTATAPVTITTPPSATIAYTGNPYCSSLGSASVTQTGTTGGTYTISPTVPDVTVNTSSGLVSFLSTSAGTYTVTYTVAASGGCAVFTTQAPIIVKPTPTITASSNSPVCLGDTLVLTASSTAPSSIFTWTGPSSFYYSGTNTQITFWPMAPGNVGWYKLTVTAPGYCSISDSIYVAIADPTQGGTATTTTSTVCYGSDATITLTGQVGTVQRWEYSLNGTDWSTATVTSSTSYTATNLTVTTQFRAVVQSGTCDPANSTPVTVTVDTPPVGGTLTPETSEVCTGTNSTLLTLSGYEGTIQKWQYSTNGIDWFDIVNSTPTYTATNLTQTTYYHVVVQNGVCPSDTSSIATITVNPASVGGTLSPSTITVCAEGNSTLLTLSAYVGTIQKWQYSTDGGSSWSDISNTDPTYTATNLTVTTQYRVEVQSGVCAAAYSATSTITVDPASEGGILSPATTSVCTGDNSTLLTLSGYIGTIQKWQYSTNGIDWFDIVNITPTYTATDLTQTTYYHVIVQSGVCNTDTSAVATITVDPTSEGGTLAPDATTVCSGTNSTLLTLSAYVGTVQKWQYSTDGTNWDDIINPDPTYTATDLTETTQYRVVVQSGVCSSANSTIAIITVDPTSVGGTLSPTTTEVCTGTNSTLLTLSDYIGTIQKWQYSTNGTTWTDILIGTATYTATNLTETTAYRVLVQSGVCDAAISGTATITVNPCGVIAGYVNYDNDYATGLNGVTVRLKDPVTGGTIATAVTTFDGVGTKGYYVLTTIPSGSYRLTADTTYTGTWGGNNATDALIINLHVIGSWPLFWLRDTVADVNASHTITPLDALWIKERVVGNVDYYPAGDWKFTDTLITHAVTTNVDLKALCVGDVNGSYVPSFKEASFLTRLEDGVMTVPVNKSFTYDIRSNAVADLGAMTLFMNYDQNRFTIDKVNSSLEGLRYRIEDGRIALAWSDNKPLSMSVDDPIISLQMTALEIMPEPVQVFTINPGSEFADPFANRLDNFDLKMSSIVTLTTNLTFSMVNYPNPFTNWTEIVYTIPEQGKVRLVLTNMFGQMIRVLVDEQQAAGTYKVKVDPADGYMQPGLYLYSIEVEGVTTTFKKTNKMLLTR